MASFSLSLSFSVQIKSVAHLVVSPVFGCTLSILRISFSYLPVAVSLLFTSFPRFFVSFVLFSNFLSEIHEYPGFSFHNVIILAYVFSVSLSLSVHLATLFRVFMSMYTSLGKGKGKKISRDNKPLDMADDDVSTTTMRDRERREDKIE